MIAKRLTICCLILRVGSSLFTLGTLLADERVAGDAAPKTQTEQSPAATKRGLEFSVGSGGLDSLAFNGQSLLQSPQKGELQMVRSSFQAAIEAILSYSPPASPVTSSKQTDTVDLTYPWGHVACVYGKQDDKMTMRIEVTNSGGEVLDGLTLRLMELAFPSIPKGATLEAGMFGYGFKDWTLPLDKMLPVLVDPKFVVPIVRVDYGTGAFNFCSDDLECSVGVAYWTNPPARTSYRFTIPCGSINPRASKTFNASLRFGPSGSSVRDLSSDILKRYGEKYPFQVKWKDHRSIGAIYLANSAIKVATNPRRWSLNSGRLDVVTEQGKAAFRAALLQLADRSIKVLKDENAQGMITWDPEGEQFLGATYYGDPCLTATLAPEMEFKGNGKTSVVDDYFAKFRAAGLRVGVCIRPQQIIMANGKPRQGEADDDHAAQVLKNKIAYAKQRWGCTLFYVDSTTMGPRPLNPNVFKEVADAYPDILLIPENESMRYFAYSVPLNDYPHHKVTSTPFGARMVYPKAFSVLMAPDGDRPEDHNALVASVRNGDILLFNGWSGNPGLQKIKRIYEEAGRWVTNSFDPAHR